MFVEEDEERGLEFVLALDLEDALLLREFAVPLFLAVAVLDDFALARDPVVRLLLAVERLRAEAPLLARELAVLFRDEDFVPRLRGVLFLAVAIQNISPEEICAGSSPIAHYSSDDSGNRLGCASTVAPSTVIPTEVEPAEGSAFQSKQKGLPQMR